MRLAQRVMKVNEPFNLFFKSLYSVSLPKSRFSLGKPSLSTNP